jgi:hypothetical protein
MRPAFNRSLLGKVLPLQVKHEQVKRDTERVTYETVEEVEAAMRERGLSVEALALLADYDRDRGRHRRSDRGDVIESDFEVIEER